MHSPATGDAPFQSLFFLFPLRRKCSRRSSGVEEKSPPSAYTRRARREPECLFLTEPG